MEQKNTIFTIFLACWSGLMVFINPINTLLLLIIVVITFDLVTGYIGSIVRNKIKGVFNMFRHFNSYKGTKSIVKLFFYIFFTIIIYLAECALIGHDSIYITKFSTFLIVFVELKSICENMDIITGRDVFTTIFVKIRKIFESKLTEKITDVNDNKTEDND